VHSKKLIDELFTKGSTFFVYPFKVFSLKLSSTASYPAQLFISVPKRNIKKATDRNKIKRLIREAYRLNKTIIADHPKRIDHQIVFGLIYTQRTILTFREIERKIILILQRLNEQDEQAAG
jgi:ribonuclease P protein component